MTIRDIAQTLSAEVICGEENLEDDVHSACGSDMMSDVLAFVKDHAVLITGLCNPQVIRTAEMMDIVCICFVRGKVPDEAMIELTTKMRMFTACGVLYEKGLGGGANQCV